MISILDKHDCCGCQACGDVCPKGAISFPSDQEGFWYPAVDVAKCVDCHRCEQVCPMLHIDEVRQHGQHNPTVFGGFHKNVAIRFESTSGGAFSALASEMYRRGGYVSGAIQNSDWSVVNFISSSKRDLARLRSSKYVQSAAAGLYRTIKNLLEEGKPVLACGSPCQMAALRTYLERDYENLVIVDFICRATNSPKVYRKYLKWLESKFGSKIISVKAKNKDHGWRSLARKVVFENGQVYYGERHEDHYRRGYHGNYFERPSCHSCKFKGFPRCADITLGDFWGIERIDRSLDHDLGTSCVLLNTDKGADFFRRVADKMTLREFSLDQVLAGNRAPLMEPVSFPPNCDRAALFADLDTMPFDQWAEKYFPPESPPPPSKPSLWRRIRGKLAHIRGILRHPVSYWQLRRWSLPRPGIDADYRQGRVFRPLAYTAVNISPKGLLKINRGPFTLGQKRNSLSRRETLLLVEVGAVLEIDGTLTIGSGADIQLFPGSQVHVKSGSFNAGLQLTCADRIEIGEDVRIGRNVQIRDNNGEHYIIQPGYTWHAPVTIGDHCWLCSNVCVMKGVTIGEGTVVAANSVVTHSLPAHCIASGNPAEVVATDIVWRP